MVDYMDSRKFSLSVKLRKYGFNYENYDYKSRDVWSIKNLTKWMGTMQQNTIALGTIFILRKGKGMGGWYK